jgi:hypothetical protein
MLLKLQETSLEKIKTLKKPRAAHADHQPLLGAPTTAARS